jgi:hypothetical protein
MLMSFISWLYCVFFCNKTIGKPNVTLKTPFHSQCCIKGTEKEQYGAQQNDKPFFIFSTNNGKTKAKVMALGI